MSRGPEALVYRRGDRANRRSAGFEGQPGDHSTNARTSLAVHAFRTSAGPAQPRRAV
ncbi:hypothetical protein C497_07744 [Halalkalicoccus jeotgali B3]|uniref:Uncharacterized protein n=1 Tax=Halalkalicoccus jeotgali (strain DSM 18796 / CECT 7217 / JCM 14584 / KCTC 4019 / B3) TaxID=795797 RepID=D8J6T7_HALJB|nr:hypothetical protein HacjB3_12545 [Halalkalicoccus jeotgali B3]ELY37987.1 hypothetical protein C497_07744 [Halalkalicoccus jeotgali B3]